MNKNIKSLIVIFLLSIPVLSFSQVSTNTNKQKDSVLKTIDSIVIRSFNQNLLKDSIALYAINFTVKVTRDKKGSANVSEVKANDSLAYELFPAYKRLYSINYNSQRIFKHYKTNPRSEDRLKDVILLNPYVWEIVNVPKTKIN